MKFFWFIVVAYVIVIFKGLSTFSLELNADIGFAPIYVTRQLLSKPFFWIFMIDL